MLLSAWRLSCNIRRAARSSTPFTLRRSFSSLPIRVRKGTTRIVPSGAHRARSEAKVSACSMYQAVVSTGSNNGPIMPARMRSWAARRLVFATSSLCSISLRGTNDFSQATASINSSSRQSWLVRGAVQSGLFAFMLRNSTLPLSYGLPFRQL